MTGMLGKIFLAYYFYKPVFFVGVDLIEQRLKEAKTFSDHILSDTSLIKIDYL